MKRWYYAIFAVLSVLSAQAEVWTMRMPDTYVLPSFAEATYISRMGERHGGSHLGMQEYTLNVPFNDPRKSHLYDWAYSLQASTTVTLLDVGGNFDLRKDELLTFSVPMTFIRPYRSGNKLMCVVMPRYSGDAVHSAHSWDVAMVADYTIKHSDTLSYSIGVAGSLRFVDHVFVPYFSFDWQATPEWQLRCRGYRLAALYSVTDRLRLGPALNGEGGAWMVDTPEGQRVLRVRSLATSLLAEYDFSAHGQTKRIIAASVGMTLATRAEICRRNGGKDRIEAHHYKPGVVASLGVDFRF